MRSKALEKQGGLAKVYLEDMIYTPLEWCGYFEELRQILREIQKDESLPKLAFEFVLQVPMGIHSIGMTYDNQTEQWNFADANASFCNPAILDLDQKAQEALKLDSKAVDTLPKGALRNNNIIKNQQLTLSIPETVEVYTRVNSNLYNKKPSSSRPDYKKIT